MATPDVVSADAPPPPPPGPARSGRLGRTLVLGATALVVALLLALGGTAAWLWRSEAALARVLPYVPGLTLDGQRGRPTGGPFSVQRLQWQGSGLRIVVEGLAWDDAQWSWRPYPGAWAGVRLTLPRAARVQVLTTPEPKPAAAPSAPPTSLRLPLEVLAPGLRVGRVEIDAQAPITALAADVHLGAAGGAEHRIERLALTRDTLTASGRAVIGTDGELPLQAAIALASVAPAAGAVGAPTVAAPSASTSTSTSPSPAWRAEIQARGPLQRLDVQARLSQAAAAAATAGTGVAGPRAAASAQPTAPAEATVQATVAPFATWPLLALAAQAERVDLSLLAPGLPQTLLSGRTTLSDPQAQRDTLVFNVQLANALPGPWDANRLPLRSLQVLLQGRPADPTTLVFDRFVAELAGTQPAGRIEGQGRLQRGNLALELVLAEVRPEQLATAAPEMRLGGTLGISVDGLPSAPQPGGAAPPAAPAVLSAEMRVDLTGRLARPGTPPLRLRTTAGVTMPPDGTLSASLRELVANAGTGAGGEARGDASAQRNATGDWRLQTRGALARFDPGLWWPAARLQRGAQSLNARWEADLTRLASADAQAAPGGSAVTSAPRSTSPAPTTPPAAPAARTPAPTAPPAAPAPSAPPRATAAVRGSAADSPSLLPHLRGSASLDIADSRFANLALRGQASLQAAADALSARAELRAGANRFQLDGRLPHARGRAAAVPTGTFDIDAPALGALAPLARLLPAGAAAWWPTQGSLRATASAQGQWPSVRSEGQLAARGLRTAQASLGRADARWNLATDGDDTPLSIDLTAADITSGAQRIDELVARLDGTPREHRLQLRASSPVRPPAWADAVSGQASAGGSALQLQATGQWAPAGRGGSGFAAGGTWRGRVAQLRAAPRSAPASPWLAADNVSMAVTLAAGGQPRQAVIEPGRIAAFGGALNWQRASWQAGAGPADAPRIELQAQLEPLSVAPLLARLQPQFGWRGDLALAGRIALRSAGQLDAEIAIARSGGDLSLSIDGATRALEISDLRVGLVARNGSWEATQALVGRNVGVVGGLQSVQTTPQALWPEPTSPLRGGLSLIVPQLQVWAPWLPPGWRLGGQLRVAASLDGTVGQPQYRGEITGSELAVRNLFEGVHLQQGTLAVALDGEGATVRQFEFRDSVGEGWLRASGRATFADGLNAELRVATEKLRLLDRFDRRITTTGSADIGLRAQALTVRGSFAIDEGLVDATQADAPKLGDDVVVVNRAPLPTTRVAGRLDAGGPGAAQAPPPSAAAAAADVDLRVDLGQALRLRGRGLDTLLRGQLRVTTPGGRLAVNGVVRAEEGTYTAYGQNLRIERGNLIFRGEVATPSLDILALRADIDERVGVVVTGSAVNPRVRLYSEPTLDELATLTWLVLGRAPEGLGRDDTALLQRAALALLAGERSGNEGFLQRLGIDELSVSRGGEGGVDETIVSLGKQISKRVYVGYEQALGAAGGTLQLIYRVANRITLRARTGEENAVDVIWTWRWN